jgi:L-rhamnose-H+ transport protein
MLFYYSLNYGEFTVISSVALALAYSVSAGVMNGSFALPIKHIKTWNFENIWLAYSVWAFLILPWVTILVFDPQVLDIYRAMPMKTGCILIVGGFLFGTGQVCFAQSIKSIGMGLSFVLNLGTGTALGTLLPLIFLHPNSIFTTAGVMTLIGVLIIFFGLMLSYSAGKKRDKERSANTIQSSVGRKGYFIGVILALLAGLLSAGQNFSFALTGHLQQLAINSGADLLTASMIIWPPFLTCCFIPYMIYMLYLHSKNNSFHHYRTQGTINNNFLGFLMAVFWLGSLIIYSKASLQIGSLGPVIVWPLFMVLIILTSNFWAWIHNEWSECSVAIKRRMFLSIITLITAVIVIAVGAVFA